MAVTRQTLKDVGNFEAKFLGPFTTRQTICLAIGIVPSAFVDYLLYNVTKDVGILFVVTFLIMVVPVFLAFGSKFCHDMKPEDYVKGYIKYHILAPKVRLYQTKTLDDIIWSEELKKQKAESPDDEDFEDEEDTSTKKKKKKKKKGSTSDNKYTLGGKTFIKYSHKKSDTIREAL